MTLDLPVTPFCTLQKKSNHTLPCPATGTMAQRSLSLSSRHGRSHPPNTYSRLATHSTESYHNRIEKEWVEVCSRETLQTLCLPMVERHTAGHRHGGRDAVLIHCRMWLLCLIICQSEGGKDRSCAFCRNMTNDNGHLGLMWWQHVWSEKPFQTGHAVSYRRQSCKATA